MERASPHMDATLTDRILVHLKHLFRAHGLRYSDVAELMGVSKKTIKRYMTGRGITLRVLERLCASAGVSVLELLELSSHEDAPDPVLTTPAQEDALAADHRLACVHYLLISGWQPNRIAKEFGWSASLLTLLLVRLDRLGLITLYPGNRVKIRAKLRPFESRSPRFRKVVNADICDALHEVDPLKAGTLIRTGHVRLGPASFARAARLARAFVNEIGQLGLQDLDLDGKHVKWYGIFALLTERDVMPFEMLRSVEGANKAVG